MNFPTLLPPPEALRRLLGQVMAGRDAVVDGPGASVLLLDQAAPLLAARRMRVLRAAPAGPEGLGLEELMAQVAGPPDAGSRDHRSLEQGAQALTVLDGRCDGIVLLLDDAETVQPAALRYIQLACRTSDKLRLVLAGMPEGLDGAEFASLRARLQAQPVLVLDGSLPSAVPKPVPGAQGWPVASPEQPPAARRLAAPPSARPRAAQATPRRTWPAAAALGMAGCIVVGVLAGRHVPGQPGGAAAMVAEAQPAAPPVTASEAPIAVSTPPPVVEAPATPRPASPPSHPGPADARQAAAEPLPLPPPLPPSLPLPPARPPGRPGVMSRQADARLRALPLHGDRRDPLRLPRADAGRPSFSTAQHGGWGEPSADSRDGQGYASQGWSGSWQGDAYPWPEVPPGYARAPYGGRGGQYEPWRPPGPWWPR